MRSPPETLNLALTLDSGSIPDTSINGGALAFDGVGEYVQI